MVSMKGNLKRLGKNRYLYAMQSIDDFVPSSIQSGRSPSTISEAHHIKAGQIQELTGMATGKRADSSRFSSYPVDMKNPQTAELHGG